MPTPTKAWAAHDGTLYSSAEQASRRDLFVVLTEHAGIGTETASVIVDQLVKHADIIVAALTTGPTSRPSARKRAGTTSPRRAAKRAAEAAKLNDPDKPWNQSEAGKAGLAARITEAQATAGFKAMRQAATPAAYKQPRHMSEGDDYVNEPRTGPVSGNPPQAGRGGTNATHDADVPADPDHNAPDRELEEAAR